MVITEHKVPKVPPAIMAITVKTEHRVRREQQVHRGLMVR
jgi:hypothetical protein